MAAKREWIAGGCGEVVLVEEVSGAKDAGVGMAKDQIGKPTEGSSCPASAALAEEHRLRRVAEDEAVNLREENAQLKHEVLRLKRGVTASEELLQGVYIHPETPPTGRSAAEDRALGRQDDKNGNDGGAPAAQDCPFDVWAKAFAGVVGLAARFEIELRVFAEEHVATRRRAYEELGKVYDAVVGEFGNAFDADTRRTLVFARHLRNKLIHCEFWTVETLLEEHSGPVSKTGSVYSYDDISGIQTNRDMTADDFRIYGWLMEADQEDGLFPRSAEIFLSAIRQLRKVSRDIAMRRCE
jgi:hypothetical protein